MQIMNPLSDLILCLGSLEISNFEMMKKMNPPGGLEILFVYFLFAFSLFVMNFVLTYEIKSLRLKIKVSLLNSLGTFIALLAVLSPVFFTYYHTIEIADNLFNGIFIVIIAFVILYSAYIQFTYGSIKNMKNEMLDKIIVLVANCLWLTVLIIVGRTWYYAPEKQGYYGSFFSMILYFYLPMVVLLLLFKILSRSVIRIKFPDI